MTSYRQRPRPVKEAIQGQFSSERAQFLEHKPQSAIVMPGDAIAKQFRLYDGKLMLIENNPSVFLSQHNELVRIDKYDDSFHDYCTISRAISKGVKYGWIEDYNILDRDGMKCLLSRHNKEVRATKKDIARFTKGRQDKQVVVLTFSVGPHATFIHLQHKYGKDGYNEMTKEERRGQYIIDTISAIKTLHPDASINPSFYCIEAAEAAVNNSFYAFLDGCHIYKDARVGTESFMLTCQLFFNHSNRSNHGTQEAD